MGDSKLLSEWIRLKQANKIRQRTTTWVADKSGKWGGTTASILHGVNKYDTMVSLLIKDVAGHYNKIRAQKSGIKLKSDFDIPAVNQGVIFEDALQHVSEVVYGIEVTGNDIYVTRPNSLAVYSPDGFAIADVPFSAMNQTTIDHMKANYGDDVFDGISDGDYLRLTVLMEYKTMFMRRPNQTVPIGYEYQVKMGLEMCRVCDIGMYVEATFRRCTLAQLNESFDHDTKSGAALEDHEYKKHCVAFGFLGIYSRRSDYDTSKWTDPDTKMLQNLHGYDNVDGDNNDDDATNEDERLLRMMRKRKNAREQKREARKSSQSSPPHEKKEKVKAVKKGPTHNSGLFDLGDIDRALFDALASEIGQTPEDDETSTTVWYSGSWKVQEFDGLSSSSGDSGDSDYELVYNHGPEATQTKSLEDDKAAFLEFCERNNYTPIGILPWKVLDIARHFVNRSDTPIVSEEINNKMKMLNEYKRRCVSANPDDLPDIINEFAAKMGHNKVSKAGLEKIYTALKDLAREEAKIARAKK